MSFVVDKIKYLERIKFHEFIETTDAVLSSIHARHVFEVPFENLDVYYKRSFDLVLDNIYDKVVNQHRGGFCYELNLLFNWLLQEIGFSSRIIASRIFDEHGVLGPEFDHMSIYVKGQRDFLIDVGYGDLFLTPLEIKQGIQSDGRNYFKIEFINDGEYLLMMSEDGVQFIKRYSFSLGVVQTDAFRQLCTDKQINPNSYFVKNVVCTKPTDHGRITMFNDKFIERYGKARRYTAIMIEDQRKDILKDKFGILI